MSSPKTVAIIPARGGSQGIPRKNMRLLAGAPLVSYSLQAAQRSRCVDAVYLSTDDAELEEIGRRFGISIIVRPTHLAEPHVGLDEVIIDAVRQIERNDEKVDFVVTVQATCPLVRPETIDNAVEKCRTEGLDTVLTIVNEPRLSWGPDAKGHIAPLYEKRANRQDLPPLYGETGGVVVCPRTQLESGSRFGKNVGVIEIEKAEAIDIDDYFDWWMAEKSLSRRRVCFHVIGNRENGLGHVYRVLTLADRLIDHDLWFLVNEESAIAAEMIERRFYNVKIVPPGEETNTILEDAPDLVVNDVLDTDETFMRALKDAGLATVNFEDVGSGSLLADYLINAMYDEHPVRGTNRAFHGIEYCCLRDEFYSIRSRKTRKEVKNVLVLFGGTDPGALTLGFLRWLDAMDRDWKIVAILGIGHEHPEKIRSFANSARHEVEVVCDTNIISRHMSDADIAITSAGRTVFELACLGVPMVVLAHGEREMRHVFASDSLGVIFHGKADNVTQGEFTETIEQLCGSYLLREKMSNILLASGVREGIERVIDIIETTLKQERKRS